MGKFHSFCLIMARTKPLAGRSSHGGKMPRRLLSSKMPRRPLKAKGKVVKPVKEVGKPDSRKVRKVAPWVKHRARAKRLRSKQNANPTTSFHRAGVVRVARSVASTQYSSARFNRRFVDALVAFVEDSVASVLKNAQKRMDRAQRVTLDKNDVMDEVRSVISTSRCRGYRGMDPDAIEKMADEIVELKNSRDARAQALRNGQVPESSASEDEDDDMEDVSDLEEDESDVVVSDGMDDLDDLDDVDDDSDDTI